MLADIMAGGTDEERGERILAYSLTDQLCCLNVTVARNVLGSFVKRNESRCLGLSSPLRYVSSQFLPRLAPARGHFLG